MQNSGKTLKFTKVRSLLTDERAPKKDQKLLGDFLKLMGSFTLLPAFSLEKLEKMCSHLAYYSMKTQSDSYSLEDIKRKLQSKKSIVRRLL